MEEPYLAALVPVQSAMMEKPREFGLFTVGGAGLAVPTVSLRILIF